MLFSPTRLCRVECDRQTVHSLCARAPETVSTIQRASASDALTSGRRMNSASRANERQCTGSSSHAGVAALEHQLRPCRACAPPALAARRRHCAGRTTSRWTDLCQSIRSPTRRDLCARCRHVGAAVQTRMQVHIRATRFLNLRNRFGLNTYATNYERHTRHARSNTAPRRRAPSPCCVARARRQLNLSLRHQRNAKLGHCR